MNRNQAFLKLSLLSASFLHMGFAQISNPDQWAHALVPDAVEVLNDASTGTALHKLAKLTGAPSTAVLVGAGATSGAIGIVVDGAGTSGSAEIVEHGQTGCVFDGATVAGDYIQISPSVAGDCHDAGSAYPSFGQVVGVVTSTNGSGGTYTVLLVLRQPSTSAGGAIQIQDEGSNLTVRPTINCAGAGITCTDNSGSSRTDITVPGGATLASQAEAEAETENTKSMTALRSAQAIAAQAVTKIAAQSGSIMTLTETSSSSSTYTFTGAPTLTAYPSGANQLPAWSWKIGTSCSGGAITGNIDSLGAHSIVEQDGSDPTPTRCAAGQHLLLTYDSFLLKFVLIGGGVGNGAYTYSQGPTSAVTQTGSYVTIYSKSVPALAAGSCLGIAYSLNTPGSVGFDVQIKINSTVLATVGPGGGANVAYTGAWEYCNTAGVQNAQTLQFVGGGYNTAGFTTSGLAMYAGSAGNLFQTPTAVDLSSAFTVVIQTTGASSTVTGTSFRLQE